MSANDRVYLLHREGRPTMVVVRTGADEEWVIGASYARQLSADLLRAANEAMNADLRADLAKGAKMPTCRECGSIAVAKDGRVTCSNCGYVAGDELANWRNRIPGFLQSAGIVVDIDLIIAEARDEGHAAGRAEALEELRREVLEMPFHRIAGSDNLLLKDDVYIAITRALAGKL